MTKPAMFLIVLCLIGGAIFGIKYSMPKEYASHTSEHGEYYFQSNQAQVVYALQPITRDTKIEDFMLGERSIERWKQPEDALPIVTIATDNFARNDIEKGQIIRMSDLRTEASGSICFPKCARWH